MITTYMQQILKIITLIFYIIQWLLHEVVVVDVNVDYVGHFFSLTNLDFMLVLVVGTGLKEETKGSSFLQTRFRLKIAIKLCEQLLDQRKFHALLSQYLIFCLSSDQLFKLQIVHTSSIVSDLKP